MAEYTGKIHYINEEKHFGYITLPGHKDICIFTQEPKYRDFKRGDVITFDIKTIRKKNGTTYEIAVSARLKNEAPVSDMPEDDKPETPEKPAFLAQNEALKPLICSVLEKKSGKFCHIHAYDTKLPGNFNLTDPVNHWLLGRPDNMLFIGNNLIQTKIRTCDLFRRTVSGGSSAISDPNSEKGFYKINLPVYGCPSFFINKDLCLNMIDFSRHCGLNLSFYYIIIVDRAKTGVYMLSLKELRKLIKSGYNNIPLGEYPSQSDFAGMCHSRLLLPVNAFTYFPLKTEQ